MTTSAPPDYSHLDNPEDGSTSRTRTWQFGPLSVDWTDFTAMPSPDVDGERPECLCGKEPARCIRALRTKKV